MSAARCSAGNAGFRYAGFQLITHGRPGELLIESEWKNAAQIATYLKHRFISKPIRHLNIYGCEFAKGEEGRAALFYLQKTLGVTIAASDDVTGKNGDWDLEIGTTVTVKGMEAYPYNLQCPTPSATDPDTDGDGVPDSVDVDDDNDGISDRIENPERYMNLAANGGFTNTGALSNWYFGAKNNGNYDNVSQAIDATAYGYDYESIGRQTNSALTGGLFGEISMPGDNAQSGMLNVLQEFNYNEISEPAAVGRLGGLTAGTTYDFSFDAMLRGNSSSTQHSYLVRLYNADTDLVVDTLAMDSLNTLNPFSSTGGKDETNSSTGYKTIASSFTVPSTGNYYLLIMSTGNGGPIDDFVFDRVAVRAASGPSFDTDGDGTDNRLDLDSDNDGIPDAIEAGGDRTLSLTNCRIPYTTSADTDANGDGCKDGNPSTTYASPNNTDGADSLDYLDLDSDNDGCPDAVEAGNLSKGNVNTTQYDPDNATGDSNGLTDAGCSVPNDNDWLNSEVKSSECANEEEGLPVTFGSFDAFIKDGSLSISWQTLREENVSRFDIEASADGNAFSKIGTIPSKAKDGSSDTPLQYEHIVPLTSLGIMGLSIMLLCISTLYRRRKWLVFLAAAAGIAGLLYSCSRNNEALSSKSDKIYLRIKQTDKDGSIKYSKTIKAVML